MISTKERLKSNISSSIKMLLLPSILFYVFIGINDDYPLDIFQMFPPSLLLTSSLRLFPSLCIPQNYSYYQNVSYFDKGISPSREMFVIVSQNHAFISTFFRLSLHSWRFFMVVGILSRIAVIVMTFRDCRCFPSIYFRFTDIASITLIVFEDGRNMGSYILRK